MRRARDITMADTDTTWQYSEHMHADVTQTIVSSALPYSPVGITRVNTNRRHSGMTDPYEREPAYLVILQLQPFGEQELWLAGKPAPHVPYGAGWLAIYDLERNWSANLVGEYVDHMALALRTHLVQTYSGVQVPSRRVQAGLAPWQEERAKALIMAHLDGEILLETLAEACGVSRAHFAKAFRVSVGMPPHRWMVLQRIERAQHYLLQTLLPLGEITHLCGFADQSHFTRTFGRVVGINPGEWRRQKRH